MCLDTPSWIEALVALRLVDRGVSPERATAVARKVRRRYEAKRKRQRHQRGVD